MLKSVSKAAAPLEPKYDLVYCAGLFDYLPDKICKQLMNIFYDMVAPGGLLIATNVDRSNPIRQMLDYVLEWHLIYRNGRQMLSLRPDRADPELTTVMSDETSVNIYLEVRKPLA
jgi:extracellular factor (EF) 3-hydroxypalmitic acid methyl ester biosynthesis protein